MILTPEYIFKTIECIHPDFLAAHGTTWVVDREISEMFVFSNVAEFNVVGTVVGQQLRVSYENCTQVSFETLQ